MTPAYFVAQQSPSEKQSTHFCQLSPLKLNPFLFNGTCCLERAQNNGHKSACSSGADSEGFFTIYRQSSVSQLDAPLPGGRGSNPHRGRQHSLVEIDHEIFSTIILPFR